MDAIIDALIIFMFLSSPFWIEAAVWLVGKVI